MNKAFNSDPIVQNEIERIIKFFNIKHVIETGTHYADTTKFLSTLVDKVDSIEINPDHHSVALQQITTETNIILHLGNSIDILPNLINLNTVQLFYLDAHWYEDWPLIKEIEIIGKLNYNNTIIIIDDFYVPYKKLQYDSYKGVDNNIENIKFVLDKAYDKYYYYYNDKAINNVKLFMEDCYGVGKIYIFPAHLIENNKHLFFNTINNINYSNL